MKNEYDKNKNQFFCRFDPQDAHKAEPAYLDTMKRMHSYKNRSHIQNHHSHSHKIRNDNSKQQKNYVKAPKNNLPPPKAKQYSKLRGYEKWQFNFDDTTETITVYVHRTAKSCQIEVAEGPAYLKDWVSTPWDGKMSTERAIDELKDAVRTNEAQLKINRANEKEYAKQDSTTNSASRFDEKNGIYEADDLNSKPDILDTCDMKSTERSDHYQNSDTNPSPEVESESQDFLNYLTADQEVVLRQMLADLGYNLTDDEIRAIRQKSEQAEKLGKKAKFIADLINKLLKKMKEGKTPEKSSRGDSNKPKEKKIKKQKSKNNQTVEYLAKRMEKLSEMNPLKRAEKNLESSVKNEKVKIARAQEELKEADAIRIKRDKVLKKAKSETDEIRKAKLNNKAKSLYRKYSQKSSSAKYDMNIASFKKAGGSVLKEGIKSANDHITDGCRWGGAAGSNIAREGFSYWKGTTPDLQTATKNVAKGTFDAQFQSGKRVVAHAVGKKVIVKGVKTVAPKIAASVKKHFPGVNTITYAYDVYNIATTSSTWGSFFGKVSLSVVDMGINLGCTSVGQSAGTAAGTLILGPLGAPIGAVIGTAIGSGVGTLFSLGANVLALKGAEKGLQVLHENGFIDQNSASLPSDLQNDLSALSFDYTTMPLPPEMKPVQTAHSEEASHGPSPF